MRKSKNIKDYLHHYIGQEFLILKTGKRAKFDYYYPSAKEPIGTYGQVKADYTTNQVRLLLRPLSDMTDKETIEITKHYAPEEKYIETGSYVVINGKMHLWLLKQGFDLFGLIKAGLAIDKSLKAKTIITHYENGKKKK